MIQLKINHMDHKAVLTVPTDYERVTLALWTLGLDRDPEKYTLRQLEAEFTYTTEEESQMVRLIDPRDSLSGTVEGWTFEVKASDGALIGTYKTGADGTIVCDLIPGTYTVTEILDENSYWECVTDISQTVTVKGGQTAEVIMLEDGIRQALAVELNEKCHIGVGEVVTDIYELRTSFRDSITRSIPDSEGTSLNDNLFAMMSKHFVQCVCVGDETEALSYLDEINQFMLTELSDESLRRYYCYKLIDVYLSGINSSGLHQSAADGELLLSFSSPQHLYDMLRYTAKKVCQQVRDAERSSEQQLQKKLLRYVDDNFRNCELCLIASFCHHASLLQL